ncbi:MAG: MATE family efflux transporter [Comamonadaceae bacterium]|nr:MATE family efflux transporter [Comamonadaceae bacterium]
MKVGSAAGSLASVFEDPTTAITSQNLGAKRLKRAFRTWGVANSLAVLLGFSGMFALVLVLEDFAPLFAGGDASIVPLVATIFRWERYSIATSATIVTVSGFFLGFKITKVTFILNLIRLFALRIPTLLLCQWLGVGPVALGVRDVRLQHRDGPDRPRHDVFLLSAGQKLRLPRHDPAGRRRITKRPPDPTVFSCACRNGGYAWREVTV